MKEFFFVVFFEVVWKLKECYIYLWMVYYYYYLKNFEVFLMKVELLEEFFVIGF